ncbi:sigma-70 family RNA polymerase sigma factor [Planctomonas psychrotolerans]|uniref:sigma-70 family RNA polymerase sigma factor n=1 Tax=Planctomonas psychrotolerans TaxID=2528712 RepID=UPI001D0D3929|nr:sigma-70 family RNA polymerase sigma factor [Planctomonas psychrotolerans]
MSTSTVRWESIVRELVERRGDALTRYAYLVCGNTDDAADLVQDALVKTFGRLRNGFTVTSAEAYVRRAILNAYLDRGRRSSRWRSIAHLAARPEEHPPPSTTADTRLDLQHELFRLSPRERACIVLRYYEDLKVDDIAEWLGISSGAVKRYLSDGLAKLNAAMTVPDDALSTHGARNGADHA